MGTQSLRANGSQEPTLAGLPAECRVRSARSRASQVTCRHASGARKRVPISGRPFDGAASRQARGLVHQKFGWQHVKISHDDIRLPSASVLPRCLSARRCVGFCRQRLAASAAVSRCADWAVGAPLPTAPLPRRPRPSPAFPACWIPRRCLRRRSKLTLADGHDDRRRDCSAPPDDSKKGTQSWIGTFEDSPGSLMVLSKASGVVTGYANYKDQTLESCPAAGGKHLLFTVDRHAAAEGRRRRREVDGRRCLDALDRYGDYDAGTSTTTVGQARRS